MKRWVVITVITILFSGFILAFAAQPEEKKPPQPPTLKERIDKWEKRLANMESRFKAEVDLRTEAIEAAKKELDAAKKFETQGKESDAQAALFKVRHHVARVTKPVGMGMRWRAHRMQAFRQSPPNLGSMNCPMPPDERMHLGPPPWAGKGCGPGCGWGPWRMERETEAPEKPE